MELTTDFAHADTGTDAVTVHMTNAGGNVSFSPDFDFFTAKSFSLGQSGQLMHLIVGNTTIPETPDSTTTTTVCMLHTNIPTTLIVKKGQSGQVFTFITSFGTSLAGDAVESTDSEANTSTSVHTGTGEKCIIEMKSALTQVAKGVSLHATHAAAWKVLWQRGVDVYIDKAATVAAATASTTGTSTPDYQDMSDLQQAINSSLFAMLSSVREDWPQGLAPGGLTNEYNGHSFWDTETWMYPSILILFPEIAKSLLQYRFNRLAGAYLKAKSYDPPYSGAMFPWESAGRGWEVCPSWAGTGLREDHISSDIALAVWQYWLATHDKAWLEDIAVPLLTGISDFWISKAVYSADGVAHITDIIPPDEYADHVDDSIYTNYSAARALLITCTVVSDILKKPSSPAVDAYRALASKLNILFDSTQQLHPEYSGYSGQIIKQADVILLHFPWEMPMDDAVFKNDLEYYSNRTDQNGPAMTWAMTAIGYKDLNMLDIAQEYMGRAYKDNLQLPYNVWSETPTGNAINFITGAGGFLQTVLYGYPGLRWDISSTARTTSTSDLGLSFAPVCLAGTTGLKIRGLQYLGASLDLEYKCYSASSASSTTACGTAFPYELTFTAFSSSGTVARLELVIHDPADHSKIAGVFRLPESSEAKLVVPVACVTGIAGYYVLREAAE